jgi:hypothetical protein
LASLKSKLVSINLNQNCLLVSRFVLRSDGSEALCSHAERDGTVGWQMSPRYMHAGMSPNETNNQPRRIRRFIGGLRPTLRHWRPIIVGVLSTALLAIASISPHARFQIGHSKHASRPVLVIAGIVCAGLAAFEAGLRQRRLDKLAAEASKHELAASAGARAVLRLVFLELDALRHAAGHYSNERLSLFRCDGDHFTLVGRRSASPTWQATAGRTSYPLNEGCLGWAWRDGTAEEQGLPPPGPGKPWNERWIRAQRTWDIPEPTARSLTMPSRSYLAFRIETPERAVGVLVFESLNSSTEAQQAGSPATLTLAQLDPLQRGASGRLAHLLRESEFIDGAAVGSLLPELPL